MLTSFPSGTSVFNKGRLKGDSGDEQCELALCTLFKVLFDICRLMGPFTPFIVENMYQNLKVCLPKDEQEDSVHYLMIPEVEEDAINTDIERAVSTMQTVVDIGRQAREKAGISLRIPIPSVTIVDSDTQVLDDIKSLEEYVKNELNSRSLILESKSASYINLSLIPDRRILGKRLGKSINPVLKYVQKLSYEQVVKFQEDGKLDIPDIDGKTVTISAEECTIGRTFAGDTKILEAQSSGSTLLIMSKAVDADCKQEGLARLIMSSVQQMRKKAGLNPEEKVQAWYELEDKSSEMAVVLTQKADFIQTGIRLAVNPYDKTAEATKEIINESVEIAGANIKLFLTR